MNFKTCCRIYSSSRWEVIPTYSLSQWHKYLYTILLCSGAGKTSSLKKGSIFFQEEMILADIDPKQLLTADFVCFSYLREIVSIQGNLKYTGHFSGPNRLDV